MLQEPRSCQFVRRYGAHSLPAFVFGLVLASLGPCLPSAWSQGLREVAPIAPFAVTQVGATLQQNLLLQVTGAPTSISNFSFANSQNGLAEYSAGTVTGCTVDGSTLNPVGTICSVPVTFQPAYPGLRKEPLQAVTNGGTFYFGVSGTGQAAQVSLTPGTLSTVAGTGVGGNTGNGGQAASATLKQPGRVSIDYEGNIFIADTANNTVREVVASTSIIVLLAGTGTVCPTPTASCGDGGLAVSANLSSPGSVAVDATGNLYIADSGDNRIRRVDASTGIITTVAGNGAIGDTGDGAQATAAAIGSPQQVIVDSSGNLYIAAAGDNAVRYVSAATGIITTLAGNGTACAPATAVCGDGGVAASGASQLNSPTGLALDAAGDLYIADSGDNRVRRVDASTGVITTVVGTGTAGYAGDGGSAASAELNGVHGIDIDPARNLYLADQGNAAVRLVLSATGTISTIAGGGTACSSAIANCGDGAISTGATLISPQSAALDSLGNLYIADKTENRIRKVFVVQPMFTFASVTAGFNSPSNPLPVLVTNIGNQPLTSTVPSSGTNPAFTSGFSYDDATSNCPLLTPSSSVATLPVGYGCTYDIDFRPTHAGTTTGSMTLAGNALNNPPAIQIVQLSGSATPIYESSTLTSSNISPAYGVAVTFTDTIPVIDNIVPTGIVSFYNGATLLGSVPATVSGVETFTLASLPVGTDSITASYSGDSTYIVETSNAVVETVGDPANTATSTSLTSSVNPSTYGQGTNLSATVGYPSGGAVPTGSVTFYATGASSTINLQATAASTTLAQTLDLAAGTYSVSVLGNTNGGLYAGWNPAASPSTNNLWTDRYGMELCATCTALVNDISGDPGYGTDAQALTAFQAAPILNMTVDPLVQGQTIGNPFTFTLTSPQSVSFYVPDGTFTNGAFTDTSSFVNATGGLSLSLTPLTPLGTAAVNSSSVATFPTTTLPIGSDSIQAVYSGDTTYVSSSSAILSQVVNKAISGGILTSSNATPTLGQSVTFTDTLAAVNGTYPTGTITFFNGSTSLGTGTLAGGIATLTTTILPLGSDTITASYPGDTSFQPGTSNSLTETVGKSAGLDTLTASTASSTFGQPVTFTDSIPVAAGVPPTGTVTFYNGPAAIGSGTVSASGIATLTISTLPVGTDSITAVYSGDSNYASMTAGPITESVAKPVSADTLTTSNPSIVFGQIVTFTDTVAIVGGTPTTGTITFYNGTSAIGTGAINASGIATLTTGSLPIGTDSITAIYSGNSTYPTATSNAVFENVVKIGGADTLTASIATSAFGQPVTFTDILAVESGAPPTGTVTFYDGATAIGASTIAASGVATLTTASLSLGSHSITAVYSGDLLYLTETSNTVSVTVAQDDFTISAAPASQAVDPGGSASYTISLAGLVVPFNEAVVLSATGLPAGASVSFTPASLTPGAGPSTSTMTIVTSSMQTGLAQGRHLSTIGYAALLLPLLGWKRLRGRFKRLPKNAAFLFAFLLSVTGLVALASIAGCGGGYFVLPPHPYTITVTGTSSSLQHATTVTLTVQ